MRWNSETSLAVTLSLLLATPVFAACPYFRVHVKAAKCALTETSHSAPTQEDETAELDNGATVRLGCVCEYALQGSAPQCDFDRTEEPSFTLPAEQGVKTCQRRLLLCEELCPRQLSE